MISRSRLRRQGHDSALHHHPTIVTQVRESISLKGHPLRFGQLLRRIPEASRKVLTGQLRELGREGIISRAEFGERSERVEYSLTSYGLTLVPVLTSMAEWGLKHKRRSGASTNHTTASNLRCQHLKRRACTP